eukprot:ANDGO_05014.mRNA.1 hypothetical protein
MSAVNEDFAKLNVAALRIRCRESGLSTGGKKQELIDRLVSLHRAQLSAKAADDRVSTNSNDDGISDSDSDSDSGSARNSSSSSSSGGDDVDEREEAQGEKGWSSFKPSARIDSIAYLDRQSVTPAVHALVEQELSRRPPHIHSTEIPEPVLLSTLTPRQWSEKARITFEIMRKSPRRIGFSSSSMAVEQWKREATEYLKALEKHESQVLGRIRNEQAEINAINQTRMALAKHVQTYIFNHLHRPGPRSPP